VIGDRDRQAALRHREMERRRLEDARARCIARFVERQRAKQQWFSFCDIADAHGLSAGPAGSPAYDQTRDFALRTLSDAIVLGEVERTGWSKVLYLAADISTSDRGIYIPPPRWLKREAYRIALDAKAPELPLDVLGCCWLSRERATAWLELHGCRLPPYPAAETAASARSAGPATPPDSDPAVAFLKPANDGKIHETITAAYDTAAATGQKPPNIKEIVAPVRAILRKRGYEASGRHIQELAGGARHAGRRRKPGPTVASEKRWQ
jgi:hypothetical protein